MIERFEAKEASVDVGPVLDKESFQFEFDFAKELSRRLNMPLATALHGYTSTFDALKYKDGLPDPLDPEIVEHSYEQYVKRLHAHRIRFTAEEREKHFSYRYDREKKTIQIHFGNFSSNPEGPLSTSQIETRKTELAMMFREIRKNHPEAEYVEGLSWLYNIEAYRRLFPESYTVHPEQVKNADEKDNMYWWTTPAVWGQFWNNDLKLKPELRDAFFEKLKQADIESDIHNLYDALPLPPLKTRGPIDDFYRLYGIL
jgi:hypothetical protein